jgi:hypothetical protein
MTGLIVMQSKLSKVSDFELRILHRSMDGDGALIEIPLRAAVTEWLIPEDETGPQMTYLEIVSATTENTGDPFDPRLITDAEIHEAIVSDENATVEDPEEQEQAIQESEF